MPIVYGAALVTAAVGALADLRTHRIPNRLTLWSGAAGLICGLILDGPGGFLRGLGGLVTGWEFSLYTMVGSFLAGGGAALLIVIRRKDGRAAVRRLWVYIENLILTGKFYRVCPGEEQGYFSFGACMFVGALAAFWKLSGR